jgi:TonB family protein
MSNDGRIPESSTVRRASHKVDMDTSAPEPLPIPTLTLLEKEPTFWRIVSNLAACISAPSRAVSPQAWMYTPMFRSAFLRRGDPSRGVLLSALLHVIAFTVIVSEPLYDLGAAKRLFRPSENISPKHEVIYYTKADLLPLISPPKPKAPERPAPRPEASRIPVKVAFHPAQTIVSKPAAPDNRRQTILQPDVPRLQPLAEVHVPNMIRWTAPSVPAPVVPTEIRRPASKPAVAPPVIPVERVVPSLPNPEALRLDASAIPTVPVASVKAPRLPVPVRIASTRSAPPSVPAPVSKQSVERGVPELPTAPAGGVDTNLSFLPNLVAISVAPAPPARDVVLPTGNRAGEFTASPDGIGEESTGIISLSGAIATTGSGESALPGDQSADFQVPGLSITGGIPSGGAATLRGTDPGADLRRLMASVSRPTLTPIPSLAPVSTDAAPLESEFFGARRVYTVYMNMPNLTSAAGSWVLRFAEPDSRGEPQGGGGELLTPEAIRKVDPMYVASAARERVQGTVTLAAVVLKDGSLANIRVVGSLDPRLDSSAVAALTQWRFHPARKNGAPIDLEVLVQIPFRI